MHLQNWEDVKQMQVDQTFRAPAWAMLVLPTILLIVLVALVWALLAGHLPGLFWLSAIVVAPIVLLIFRTNFLPSLRSTNWVLKIRGNTAYLMLRNFRERHFPDDGPVVASFEFREIASIGKFSQKITTPSSDRTETTWTRHSLEIRLRNAAPPAFVNALQAERDRRPPAKGMVRRKSYYPSPVTLVDAHTIRVLWRGQYDMVRPSLDKAVAVLSRYVKQHQAESLDQRQPEHLSDTEFDNLILMLCENGNTLDAVKLLKRHRGYSTTTAKRFVDELTGSAAT